MYAVVEAGGRQYQLTSGRYVDVEMAAGEPQSEFVFDRVLMIVNGDQSVVGKPLVDGAKVTGKIISHGKGAKIVVYKYRPKKGTRKRTGHRQRYTRIFIDAIRLNDEVLSEAKDEGKLARAKGEALQKAEEAKPANKAAPKADKAEKPAKAPAESAAKAEAAPKKNGSRTTKKD